MAESKDMMSKILEHLSAYKSACEDHPDLKAFDSSLQQKTIKVVDALVENETLSIHDLHMEVSEHLHEVTGVLANFILESKNDVWENEEIRSLVEAYFDNTGKTLEILNTVMASVEAAEMGQLVILEAVDLFDKESSEKDGGKKKSYEKTLKKLKKFKAMEDPFDGQVLQTQFQLINKQNESLMEEVFKVKTKLQKENQILNAIVGASISTVAVGAMATMTTGETVGWIAAIPFVGVLVVGVGWLGYSAWKENKEAEARLKGQEEAVRKLVALENVLKALDKGLEVNKEETKTVSILVNQLETKINSITDIVDVAIEDEKDDVDLTLVLNRIKEKVNDVTTKIKEVGKQVAECSRLMMEAKTKVDEKIVRYRAEV